MNKTIEVQDLMYGMTSFSNCYATISSEGMTITWYKVVPNYPIETLNINVPRVKMLELAEAINVVKE